MMRSLRPIHVIGGGLAGAEAAWQVARRSVPVVLHEMRPVRATAVHKTGNFAELVCSNSLRSDDADGSAIGLLHAEMRRLGSLVVHSAATPKPPGGGGGPGACARGRRDGLAPPTRPAPGTRAADRHPP